MKGNFYSGHEKIVINCTHCRSKLRVPVDKGKISVTCPMCGKEFIYNPDSILHTLKQIVLSGISRLPKTRRNRVVLLIIVLIILAAFIFLLSRPGNQRNTDEKPGKLVYGVKEVLYHADCRQVILTSDDCCTVFRMFERKYC